MKNNYLIWLDDERPVPMELWNKYKEKCHIVPCHNYESAKGWLEQISVFQPESKVIISFDHDLGVGKTGYDVAKFIVENNIKLHAYAIHSMNSVGVKNISELLNHYGYRRVYGILSQI